MADEDDKHENAPLRVAAFIDREGDPVACVIIGGLTFARLEPSLEEAMKSANIVIETMQRLVKRSPDSSHTNIMPRDPSKEN
jgi:hypothetical protein